jgi:Protein of unknown function (DUF2480)
MSNVIVNKVAESSLVTLNLEDYYPQNESVLFDIKDFLFMGLILKEKDFRAALLEVNWEQYKNKNVAVTCTADAVVPVWAYMLITSYLQAVANEVVFGTGEFMHKVLFLKNLSKINPSEFADKRIVVKGCGDLPITEMAYVEITRILRPVAKSIMYGEPCSTVPIFKKK